MRNGDVLSKHIFAGNSRIASKLEMRDTQGSVDETGIYYVHPDHLGSSSVITTKDGSFHESIEYFPYAETWIHNKASEEGYSTPYKFTSKEQDPETGLYYYGARYYDPVLSRWISTDPPMMTGEYLPEVQDRIDAQKNNEEYKPEESLPGMGGIYNIINIDLYHFSGQNPLKFVDPDGNQNIPAPVFKSMDNFFRSMANKLGINYKTYGDPYKPNTFYKVMKVLTTELTPGGTIARVGLGINPYTQEKLSGRERLTEAGVTIVTIGIARWLKVGNQLYKVKASTSSKATAETVDQAIDNVLDALDYGMKSGFLGVGEKGIYIIDKSRNTYRGLDQSFPAEP